MTHGPTIPLLMVLAATLAASWALATGIEIRWPAPVKSRRRGLPGRTVLLLTLTALVAVSAGAGALGVRRWRTYRSLEAGARLLAEGNATAAVRVLVNVVASRPDDARAHYHLGEAYARLGLAPAAMTHLKEAVRLAPDEARFRRGLGAAYRRAGDTPLARSELEAAVRLEPDEPAHRVALTGALIDGGDVESALEHLRRVAKRHDSPEIHLLLAMTLKQAGDHDRGLHELQEVIRLAPDGALGEIARQEVRAVAGGRGAGHAAGGTSR